MPADTPPLGKALEPLWSLACHPMAITDAHAVLLDANPCFTGLVDRGSPAAPSLTALPCPTGRVSANAAGIAEVLARTGERKTLLALRRADGTSLWLEATAQALPRGDGTDDNAGAASLWLWQFTDVTELQLSLEAGRQMRERLELVQVAGRLALWERDPDTGLGQWDPNMYRLFGYDTAVDTPTFDEATKRIHPQDQALVRQAFTDSLSRDGRHELRYRVMWPDGSTRIGHSIWNVHTGEHGELRRVVGVMLDDTETYELARSVSAANELLRLATDLGQISIWRHDLKTNRMYLNEHGFSIAGMAPRPEGLSADEVRSMIHPDDLAQVRASVDQALSSDKPVDMQARYRRGEQWRQVLARRVVQRDENGTPVAFVGVGLDITDQLAQARRSSEIAERFELATHAAGVGIWYREPRSGALNWNRQMFALYDRDPSLGVPDNVAWLDRMIHPDDRARMTEIRRQIDSGMLPRFAEAYRILLPSGQTRWLESRARIESIEGQRMVLGVSFDVTERVQAEAALRSANQRVALAARGAGIGTWEMGPEPGSLTWDEQMFRLRGLPWSATTPTIDEMMARAHPDDRAGMPPVSDPAFFASPPNSAEFRVGLPDGSWRWLATRSSPITDDHGRVIRRVGVNWDITEGKQIALAMQEREIALRESRAKSRFLARMSHELRTPLNAVLGFAQLLASEDLPLAPAQRERVKFIRAAGEHLLSLIDEVLDLSSLESGELKLNLVPVAIADTVAETLPLIESMAREHRVHIDIAGTIGTVLADRTRLRQILVNLVSNGIKYNRPGGRVTLGTAVQADRIVLTVSDDGRGMNAAQLEHLFEPFNRLGAELGTEPGTGIGLAIVKALTERMDGRVAVRSQPGTGSSFEVSLPSCADEPAGAPLIEAPDAMACAGGLRHQTGSLLYIEDNAVNVLLVEQMVHSFTALSIVSEATGQAGVDRAFSLQPDLILVDMQLPDFDGFEVLARLRADPRTASIVCVALSANAMPEDIARARAAGFADYWTKPIDIDEFLTALARTLPAPQVPH